VLHAPPRRFVDCPVNRPANRPVWVFDGLRALALKVEPGSGERPPLAALPAFAADRGIPAGAAMDGRFPVRIADWEPRPVWFTERSDANFHIFMAQFMDKPVEGAVGGNIFAPFVMTLDYPRSTAYFRCAAGCREVTQAGTR
jgi:hypothetical protein